MTDYPRNELKFAADKTLSRLVRWLRVMGQDVIHGPHLAGRGLVRFARQGFIGRNLRSVIEQIRVVTVSGVPPYESLARLVDGSQLQHSPTETVCPDLPEIRASNL